MGDNDGMDLALVLPLADSSNGLLSSLGIGQDTLGLGPGGSTSNGSPLDLSI
ncbi:hypothetical protein VKT23_019613 [Stygiomarasmius scandens]|uniref:Uncharacterized protein n=1 Tax=Marasmiellus scandens TaxID=2682957 RepID=A0ABR1IQ09_9AGAR